MSKRMFFFLSAKISGMKENIAKSIEAKKLISSNLQVLNTRSKLKPETKRMKMMSARRICIFCS